jgi:hypothetical protein
MNRVFYMLAFAVVAVSVLMLTGNAAASTYTANFDTNIEGWDAGGDGPYYGSTGGQDGGGYAGSQRNGSGGYFCPSEPSPLYGDVAANLGSTMLTYSYYLKSINGNASSGGKVYVFAQDVSKNDTIWDYTPADTSVPLDWKQYTFTVDTTATTPPEGWSEVAGTMSWADSWKHVTLYNFWNTAGNGLVDNGIDTISVGPAGAVPEPATISLLITGLLGLLAYAWRKRK